MCFKALENEGYVLRYIKNPTEKMKLIAVKNDGFAIDLIKNPTEEMQILAVQQNGNVIKFIKNPSEKVQEEAVKQNGLAIQYIENPSEKIQEEAIKQNFNVLRLDIISNSVKNQVFDNNEENLALIFSSIDKAIKEELKEKNSTLKKN